MTTHPVTEAELERLPERLPGWSRVSVDGVVRIERTYPVPDYATAMSFTQLLGEMADAADHHPTVLVQREHVTIAWWTMSTRSLTQLDLTMAQRTDRLFDALNNTEDVPAQVAVESSVAESGQAIASRDTSRRPPGPAAEER